MIGVFDSGVGGLSALMPLQKLCPHADILYYADTASLPLGMKSDEEILARLTLALRFFENAGVSGVLLACGTASSLLTKECKESFAFPIIDIIVPAATAVKSLPKTSKVLLLATPAAIKAERFSSALVRKGQTLFSLPCPRLVPLAEKGKAPISAVRRAVLPALRLNPDAIVLGCTHFSHLKGELSTLMPKARLIDAAYCAAAATASRLENIGEGRCRFLTTGNPVRFEKRASLLLSRPVQAEKITP